MYEPDLREEFGDSRGWLPRLTVPRTDTLLTLPTHPVYAGEGFDVMVFNHELLARQRRRPDRLVRLP